MADSCVDENIANEYLNNGLRILARIIARDFMAKQTLNGDGENAGSSNGDIQNK
ncbi:MAG: hypothetical protein H6753_07100 [Candidatus Omnitrophica bacterium]|nr:hypothetical protein [Candidatus Omnitrophota bacterium]